MKKQTKIGQIIEAIITHPEETININDLCDQFPDWKRQSVASCINDATHKGYLKPGKQPYGQIRSYTILHREPLQPVQRQVEKRRTVQDEIDMEQLGEGVFSYIEKLKRNFTELSQSYSDLQSELSKEVASNKMVIKNKNKTIAELEENNEVLRTNLKKSKKTFRLGEMATFKTKRL